MLFTPMFPLPPYFAAHGKENNRGYNNCFYPPIMKPGTKPTNTYRYILLIIIGLGAFQASAAQGLRFCGGEQPIDKRTSYNVLGNSPAAFSGYFDIEFDLSLYPTKPIGYILRIKNEKSNKIYNLFYDGQGSGLRFRLNEEGRSSLIIADARREEMPDMQWSRMKISFDLKNDSIRLTVGGRTFSAGEMGLPDKYYPIIVFGKSDHIIDVPSFAIKDLSVSNDSKRYFFALREHAGNTVHDQKGRATGSVVNPEWLINDSYQWHFVDSFQSETVAGTIYNPGRKEIYYFNRDRITIYNVRSGEVRVHRFEERCPVELTLGTSFIDNRQNRLYVYDVYVNSSYEGVTVASLDLDTYKWRVESTQTTPTQLHHHGAFYNPDTERYTIFGGFGHMRYSKDFHSFDIKARRWETLPDFEGDVIFPRYFSSMGYLRETNTIYIFGGMGNESGEQVVGRKYFYDLHEVNLDTGLAKKLWEIPWTENHMVPVRGMLVLDDSYFYTLCYPEHFSDSFLRLYRFSLKDGSYEILGDSIPIHSDRITTNANLYYDEQLNNLYALVQEFEDDIISDLKIYSLAFPPVTAEELANYPKGGGENNTLVIIILLSCAVVVAGASVLFVSLKPRNDDEPEADGETAVKAVGESSEKATRPNSAYLFGDFTVRDRNNRDITYMFSARLRQTFCLILQYSSTKEGITSQHLSNMLWPDRPEDKVKNSRGVTINHLRKVLSEMDGIELIYDKGCFRIVQTDGFYCDYSRCIGLIINGQVEENRDEMAEIVSRGKFLKFSDHALFDSFKKEVEHLLEPVLLIEMEKSFEAEAYQMTMVYAEAVFNIDPLNDEALAFMVRAMQRLKLNDEARIRYQAFVIEYKKTMGNDYPQPFKNI